MIDSHGPDHVSKLMQKVISALEHLEKFASQSDEERETIDQLSNTIKHLELEEIKKNEERQRNARVNMKCHQFRDENYKVKNQLKRKNIAMNIL